MNQNLLKMLKRSALLLFIALLTSCSGGDHYVLTAEIAGGEMTATVPAEGGYIDIDVISNVPWRIMELSPDGIFWVRWQVDYLSSETISVSGDKSTVRITLHANTDLSDRWIYIRFANEKGTLTSGAITLTQDMLIRD